MTTGAKLIATFYLVTRVCFTTAILAAKLPRDSSSTSVQSSELNNRQAAIRALSAAGLNQAIDSGAKLIGSSRGSLPKIGYLYLNPSTIEFQLPSKEVPKTPFDRERYRSPASPPGSIDGVSSTSSRDRPGEVEQRAELEQGSSYQVEELDEYVTAEGDSDGDGGDRGKAGSTYRPRGDAQELTAAIKALDRFLSGILNGHGYNSPLHPPNNPVLALVLSRYGRYVPAARAGRLYAYNAVNNLHNNQPFGRYKQECEDEPTFVGR